MNTSRLIAAALVMAISAIAASEASAMYNPATGRFLQRDPGPGGVTRIGNSVAATPSAFLPRDSGGHYVDGMNLYQYVRSNPLIYADPSGRITWAVDEDKCEITAIFSMKPMWLGDWTPERKESFLNDLRDAVESTFNNGPYRIIPKNKEYKTILGKRKPCPCPNGFKPAVSTVFYENTIGFALAIPDWQPTVRANPTKEYQQSWTAGSLGGINEGGATAYDKGGAMPQKPAVHEFGHALGHGHPGDLKSKDVYGYKGTDVWGNEVDGNVDLMGKGMGLRPFYYDRWKNHLNANYSNWFCDCDYQIK